MKKKFQSLLLRLRRFPVVHALALRLVKRFFAPYFATPFSETSHFHWDATSAAKCVDNRPLGEGNIVPAYLAPDFELSDRIGKLSGSRKGLPVNQTALHIVMRNLRPAVDIISVLRTEYDNYRLDSNVPLNNCELMVFGKICSAMPAYLLRRANNPIPDGKLPADVATVFKLMLGVQATVESMINSGDKGFDPFGALTAESFYDYADTHGMFVSARNAACGGPTGKILEIVDLAINGVARPGPQTSAAERTFDDIGDSQKVVRYGLHVSRIESAIRMFQANIASVFCGSELEKSAKTVEEMEHFVSLKMDAINDPPRADLSTSYWDNKAIILERILDRVSLQDNATKRYSAEFRPPYPNAVDSEKPSYSEVLERSFQSYEKIVDRAWAFCDDEQQHIFKCLEIESTTRVPRILVSRRLNANLFSTKRP